MPSSAPETSSSEHTAALRELAQAIRDQTEVNRLLIAALPASVEAKLTGRSTRTIHRQRAARKARQLIP